METLEFKRFDARWFTGSEMNIPIGTDLFHVYPDATEVANQLLAGCREYKSLDNHAVEYLRKRPKKHSLKAKEEVKRSPFKQFLLSLTPEWITPSNKPGIREQQLEAVKQQLKLFINSGHLISRKELFERVQTAISNLNLSGKSPEKINILGIPTCNRGELLVRCVQSYLDNLHQHDRKCQLHIVDDSDPDKSREKNRQAVEKLCRRRNIKILWADRSYRQAFADRLTKATGLPQAITRFALLGDPHVNFTTGSSRNTLLLLAAGEPSIQTDDDTLCRIIFPPWESNSIALATEDCHEYRFFNNRNAVSKVEKQSNKKTKKDGSNNVLSLHEDFLGKHPGMFVRENSKPNINRLSGNRLLEKLNRPGAHIGVTFWGALGDSGMHQHWPRLCFEGSSFQQLIKDASLYRPYLCTRQLYRCAPQPTVADTAFCMGMHMGLNTSKLLPPFMPVQRNEDGIFGQLLYLCFSESCQSFLPYAIRHNPQERPVQVDPSRALRVGPLRTNVILLTVLRSLDHPDSGLGTNTFKNLMIAGSCLHDLSRLSAAAFKEQVTGHCSTLMRNRINYLQQYLNERTDAPAYWQKDVKKVITNFRSLLQNENACVPSDLPGDPSNRLKLLQELTGKFGQLLIHWPDIWEAAVNIREGKYF